VSWGRMRPIRVLAVGLPVVGLVGLLILRPFGPSTYVPSIQAFGAGGPSIPSLEGCDQRRPSFRYGFAALKQRLGSVMGDPLECEHAIHVGGDTRQTTTTGYAYYRRGVNVPSFTDGWEHWALTDDGLVHWSGNVVDPPRTAPAATPASARL